MTPDTPLPDPRTPLRHLVRDPAAHAAVRRITNAGDTLPRAAFNASL